MKLAYQLPGSVMICNTFPDAAFVLQNTWNLEEIDLDKRLNEARAQQQQQQPSSNTVVKPGASRFQ